MSGGSDKLPCFEHLPSELSYIGQPVLGSFPSAAPIPPHPLIAHIYPWSTGSNRQNFGRNQFSTSISQTSTAAALVARYVNANLSPLTLQNFSKRILNPNDICRDDKSFHSEEPLEKKDQFQLNADSLSGTSLASQPNDVLSSSTFRSTTRQSAGPLSNFTPAWQQFLFRCRSFDNFDSTMRQLSDLQTNASRSLSVGRNRPRSESNLEPSMDRSSETYGEETLNEASLVERSLKMETHADSVINADENLLDTAKSEDGEGLVDTSSAFQQADNFRPRNKRKRSASVLDVCPICGVTVRGGDVQSHIALELDKLHRIPGEIFRKRNNVAGVWSEKKSFNCSASSNSLWMAGKKATTSRNRDKSSCLKTYQKVRSNRLERLNTRVARGLHAQNGQSDATGGWFWPVDLPNTCPICFSRLAGDQNVIRQHISRCLRQRNVGQHFGGDEEKVSIDLIASSSRSTNDISQVGKQHQPNLEECLNVDGDDSLIYGPLQYDDEDLTRTMDRGDEKVTASQGTLTSSGELVTSLRSKITKLENDAGSNQCMICMSPYKDPVTSIQCWHVHCECCWLEALRIKKLCPQCNSITPLNKLRRIYL